MAGTEARRHQAMVEAGVPAGHFNVTFLQASPCKVGATHQNSTGRTFWRAFHGPTFCSMPCRRWFPPVARYLRRRRCDY